jgi:hypothetical protein
MTELMLSVIISMLPMGSGCDLRNETPWQCRSQEAPYAVQNRVEPCVDFHTLKPDVFYRDMKISLNGIILPKCE